MKRTGLRRLYMEAEEIAKNILWLQKKIENSVLPRERDRNQSNLKAQEKKLEGLKDKAFNYGKGDVVWGFKVKILNSPNRNKLTEMKIYYSNVEEEELDLLLNRDLKGLKYKVLKKTRIKTGELFE